MARQRAPRRVLGARLGGGKRLEREWNICMVLYSYFRRWGLRSSCMSERNWCDVIVIAIAIAIRDKTRRDEGPDRGFGLAFPRTIYAPADVDVALGAPET